MIYKIEYNTTNFYYKNMIEEIITESKVKAECRQYIGYILIFIDSNEKDISDFISILNKKLPHSMFVKMQYPIVEFDKEQEELEDFGIKQNLSYYATAKQNSKILEEKINYYNDIVKIKNGEISTLETHNGSKSFFLPNKIIREKFENNGYEVKLLALDVDKLEEILEVSLSELKLICSLERPLVKLRFKDDVNLDKNYSSSRAIYVKAVDDKETISFGEALLKEGIFYVMYVTNDAYQNGIKVLPLKNKNIIISGNKGLFPRYDYFDNRQYNSTNDYFDFHNGVYEALVSQNSIKTSSIGIYFSKNSPNSSISILIDGKKDELIHIPNIQNSLKACIKEVKYMNEKCKTLFENYEKIYKLDYSCDVPKNSNGFGSILNIIVKLLGLKDIRELEDFNYNRVIKNSVDIDMSLENIDNKSYLDYRKIVCSILKHKIQGVENSVIIYSFYYNLAKFIEFHIEKIALLVDTKNIVICGNLFENRTLIDAMCNLELKNYNLILSKDFPIDY